MALKDASLYPSVFHDPMLSSAIPISYSLTPPTPDSTDSDVSSSSQLSMESIPEFDDMPEIPFVSASVAYADADAWPPSERPAERARLDDGCEPHSFWSNIIGLRSSPSKFSEASSVVLGSTSVRSISPSRASRKRAGSVSSIASSRTKPAPAKSILSSSASVRTRRQKAPSVKFLDMPTVHYDDEYPCRGSDDEGDEDGYARGPMSPPPKKKTKGLGGFFTLRWLFGPSKIENRPAAPVRPAISGPFPLCDAPPRRARGGSGAGNSTAAASLRSVKSSTSLRSVRSCGSRLPTPTYWPR
ncbi:hypothetical protein C8Q79DRAFT_1004805 [Trametes meyenii]|nr:hypothetical protein C8Q79DRAFT_1004805 [Trametes meyenii]